MRKVTKFISLACLAVLFASASASAQSGTIAGPGKEESSTVTICYYGVTMQVSQKIAKRYMKLGATMGACGQSEPQECLFPFIPDGQGGCIFFPWIGSNSVVKPNSAVEKPAHSEKMIPLDLPDDEATRGLLSLNTREAVGR